MANPKDGSQEYLWICRWEQFQHYPPREDSGPAWIKAHTKQLSDDRYLDLTAAQRAVLHDLRMEFARSRGRLTSDPRRITQRLCMKVTRAQLEALNHAGFIEFVSREVLEEALERFYASRAPARSLEAEAEKDSDGEAEKEPLGLDVQEVSNGSSVQSNGLPDDLDFEVQKLIEYIDDHGDLGTPRVVAAYARNLPASAVAKVRESTKTARTKNRARYVVGALKLECSERGVLP